MAVISIVYPADPTGIVPGGIDTFIRGIAKCSPPDIDVRLIGFTTDPAARPVGRWTRCPVGSRGFDIYPVVEVGAAGSRGRVPLSVRFTAAVARHRAAVDGDILEFHRLEPALLFRGDPRPRNAFVHQNMKQLRNRKADILWSRWPALYYRLEDLLMPGFDSVFVVSEEAVGWYRERYPALAARFNFTPTWVDPDDFHAPAPGEREAARRALLGEFGWPADAEVLLSVGRLDQQKDPLLLADAFAVAAAGRPALRLLYVGDGVLRPALEERLAALGLGERVRLAGLRAMREIAAMLHAADLFVMSSAYEGMPMSVLEAVGSGVPVVTTDVGEVRRVVVEGRSGRVVGERTAQALAAGIVEVLDQRGALAGARCQAAAAAFAPSRILEPVYANYRRLAGEAR